MVAPPAARWQRESPERPLARGAGVEFETDAREGGERVAAVPAGDLVAHVRRVVDAVGLLLAEELDDDQEAGGPVADILEAAADPGWDREIEVEGSSTVLCSPS